MTTGAERAYRGGGVAVSRTCDMCRWHSTRYVTMPLPPEVEPVHKVEHLCAYESGALIVRATLDTRAGNPVGCHNYAMERQ
jgi:hypothetical protein